MECLHAQRYTAGPGSPALRPDREKIARIRTRISEVFGRPCTWDDERIARQYSITPDGDLIMIIR